MSAGLCRSSTRAVGQVHPVDDRRRGRDQVEVELARQPLLDDLEVQQAEKAAAEAEAERRRGLRLVDEAGVVEAQFGEAVAQPLVIGGIGREQAAEHDRLHRLEAGQRLGGRAAVLGDRVADPAIGDGLDAGGDKADLAGPELGDRDPLRGEDADPLDLRAPRRSPSAGSSGPASSLPSLTRTRITTPRYGSYQLSTSSALSGAVGVALRAAAAG